jgi:two-component system sensor histidine kinase UhpB
VSLRTQLLGTIGLVLLGTLLLGSIMTYWHALRKIDTEMSAAIAVGARITHNAADDAEEVTNPARRLQLLVADFDGDRHLQASLIGPDGSVVAKSELARPEDNVPAWFVRLLDRPVRKEKIALPRVFDGHGTFILQANTRNEIGEVWNDLKLFSSIITIFCSGILLVTVLLIGRALRPLQSLTAAFARIGTGDYAPRIEPKGPTEFVDLSNGFNHMAARLADMEESNARLVLQLETVQEEERTELARNLHDEVSPLLFSVDVDATSLRQNAPTENVAVLAKSIQDAVRAMKGNVKAILGQLRPVSIAPLNVRQSIEELAEFWKARHDDMTFDIRIPDTSWGQRIDSALHAIIRESVINAVKHSKPSAISVDVRESDGKLTAEITDNGGGMTASTGSGGFGIAGMRERAANLGGNLTVENRRSPAGVIVRAQLPVTPSARQGAANDPDKKAAVA